MNYRVFPVLLLNNRDFVKSFCFQDYQYLGDPENTLKIFNEKFVDELVILDITDREHANLEYLSDLMAEVFIPVTYGGNINSSFDVENILSLGVERVALLAEKFLNTGFINEVVNEFGSSSVCAVIDVGQEKRYATDFFMLQDRLSWCRDQGVSEVIIQVINRDGMREGLDLELAKMVTSYQYELSIVLGGGLRDESDLNHPTVKLLGGVASSSLFVFAPGTRSVLINNPFVDYSEMSDVYNL